MLSIFYGRDNIKAIYHNKEIMMKVKLKNEPVRISGTDVVDGKFAGIDLEAWKKLNRGDTIELNNVPKDAEQYVVSLGTTTNTKIENKGSSLKGGK